MKSEDKLPKIFIISGPSGAGEDSVIEGLQEKMEFNRIVTTVTRKMRPGESEGHPYYFTTIEEFKKMIGSDEFIERAIVYGDYRGCTKAEIERLLRASKPILWKVDWQGVKTIKDLIPNSVSIFISPPSFEALTDRLVKRGKDSAKTIENRSEFTKEWLKHLKHEEVYDHIIVNKDGKLAETIQKVYDIITKKIDS